MVYTIFARAQAESSEGTGGGGGGGGMVKSYAPRMLMLVGGLLVIGAVAALAFRMCQRTAKKDAGGSVGLEVA